MTPTQWTSFMVAAPGWWNYRNFIRYRRGFRRTGSSGSETGIRTRILIAGIQLWYRAPHSSKIILRTHAFH